MNEGKSVALWEAPKGQIVADNISAPDQILACAKQFRDRDRKQVIGALKAGHYEMAASYTWLRTMALLKKQLAMLGSEFIGELLQRPDLKESSDPASAISDAEAISLAQDLGVLTATQSLRLRNSHSVVSHFSGVDEDVDVEDDEYMSQEEAIQCLRICVQGILGHEKIASAEDFAKFRINLETTTFTKTSPELIRLQQSPYFFVRTAISILLAILRSEKGAQIEHASRNANLIVPMFWSLLKKPEKWQIGQAYAELFADGKKDAVRALHSVLIEVKGFDFVPETLRSNTFTKVAHQIIEAHHGMNNFYKEPGPMKELASLGTSIPSPAFANCLTATLCVKLGNTYGVSWAAQEAANTVLAGVSQERWLYYIDERLEDDRMILSKLMDDRMIERWISLVEPLGIDPADIESKVARNLISATNKRNKNEVRKLANAALLATT